MSCRLTDPMVALVQRVAATCMLLLLWTIGWPADAATLNDGPRVALVIGNAGYRTMPLTNPVNDARAVADALQRLGFKVIRRENASQQQMHDAVREFGDALKGGVGLFYFAGHGVQVKGSNFLIPVDAAIEREDEVPYKAFDVGLVLAKMETAKNPLNIVILDACRNNPFARGSRSATRGLAQIDAPTGSIVAFATAPGAEAADGSGANGLYTSHLLQHMATPGLKVEDVFKRTRVAVKQSSNGKQIPWESTSLEGDFYFKPPSGGVPAANAPAAASAEAEVWSLVSQSDTPSAYRAYLERYPAGAHAEEAKKRVAAAASVASDGRACNGPPCPGVALDQRLLVLGRGSADGPGQPRGAQLGIPGRARHALCASAQSGSRAARHRRGKSRRARRRRNLCHLAR
ncbi:caspase family protein [Piscinibacter sakaiensis]|uniref:caspase family protein n=1 Tax=Piscinibacter sakaiensis TaxID=1547922 RepID=UPI003AAE7C11